MENQFTNVGRKGEEKEQWEYKTTRKKQDGIGKFLHINKNSKCKWTEFTNQRPHSGWMAKYTGPRYVLPTTDSLQL